MSAPEKQISNTRISARLRRRLRWAEAFQPTELQVTLFWAGVIGFIGAWASVGFRRLTEVIHTALTGQEGGYVESFARLPVWARLAVPAAGGLLAGLTIFFGMRWRRQSSTDYMEAIVLGDGVVSARSSAVKCLSAMFSIASGASIGREGPLVQLSAMAASLIGRWRKIPMLRLRLLVACGAAAGIASAYNAPIAGAMFVAEIVLQSMAMESFGPLVFSSVVATLTVRQILGDHSLYEMPAVRLGSNWEIVPLTLLGVGAGFLAPWFLRLLRASEAAFTRLALPAYFRLGLGGLLVGALAMRHPDVCGNGYSVVNQILHGHLLWQGLLLLLGLKIVATALTFGSGAMGGVFTPTLFVGASLGYLAWQALQTFWPTPLLPQTFVVVGMGSFLAATTHAPIMAIIMVFELTLDYQLMLPLMLACVVSHYACLAFEKKSIYADSLRRKGADLFRQYATAMTVGQVMKPDPIRVLESAGFRAVAESFVANRFGYLYVTNAAGKFRGAISLHDVKSYLTTDELGELVIARDIMRDSFATIGPGASLTEALDRFARHDGERLPVITQDEAGQLIGSISKSDVILALAERQRA